MNVSVDIVLLLFIGAGSVLFLLSAGIIFYFALQDMYRLWCGASEKADGPTWREVRMKGITALFLLSIPSVMWLYYFIHNG